MAERIVLAVGDDVALRSYARSDAAELFALVRANQRHLERWMPWAQGDLHIQQTRDWLRTAARGTAEGSALQCAVVVRDRIAGSAGFNVIDRVHLRGEIGYWLAEDAQGRGTMTAAVRTLVEHGFGPMGLHRVQIAAAPVNARSRAIPERLGFTLEGVLRECEKVGDRWHDHVVYGLLAAEWRARQASP